MNQPFDLGEYIMHHASNSPEWHVPFLPPIKLPGFLSLHGLMLLFAGFFLIILFVFLFDKKSRVPHGITNLLEVLVVFIRDDIVMNYLGEKDGKKMTPLFCTFFFFILMLNLMGLIPLFSSATANFNVTGALALVTFSFMVFGAIHRHGIMVFLKSFVPSGVPFPILVILVPIEFLGLFIKTFALMIRLFANMLAGHIAILSLLGLGVVVSLFVLPLILPIALFISLLEVLVAFLQAYVFTLLSAVFIAQAYHPEH